MRIVADYHHHDLWESLELLCARFGWELLRPIGMDWFTDGYWNHERKWHGDAIARQYLDLWGSDTTHRFDRSHGRYQRLVTLEEARDLRPEIVLSTLAHNHEGFHRFATEVGATFGLQIGNVRFSPADMAEDRWDLAAFGLVSGFMPAPPPKPHVVYHQEFDLTHFAYTPPWRGHALRGTRVGETVGRSVGEPGPLRISSFVQCYPETEWAYGYFLGTAAAAPEFDWRVYGAYGSAPIDQYAAGNIDVCADVAKAMQASDVAWHLKRWSDGYGHVYHNWVAVGRPLIGFRSYYETQIGGALWLEGVNAWDIENRTLEEVAALLRRFRDDEEFHLRACEAAATRFRQVVNFDVEAEAIRRLVEQVLP